MSVSVILLGLDLDRENFQSVSRLSSLVSGRTEVPDDPMGGGVLGCVPPGALVD